MALFYYYDLMSQPCRALYMFLRLNKIPYEDKLVALRKGEHLSKEYTRVHPFNLVPAVTDGNFHLTESLAIVDYVVNTQQIADHWYPSDIQKRARVMEYLHWQHLNTRAQCALLFQHLLIIPRTSGKPVDQEQVSKQRKAVQKVVQKLENYFLKNTPFISSQVITVADLFAACELMQLYAVMEEELYESSPMIKAWMKRVQHVTSPLFDETHRIVYRVRDMYKGMSISKL
ncbi:glutathione S-transferase theta-1-like [Babylonia areolata]|uniref:glutathione S-transferase theta-1-like n=1 Tax=Babylonia areolata TaxID=304850 RepID=UPI003FD2F8DA